MGGTSSKSDSYRESPSSSWNQNDYFQSSSYPQSNQNYAPPPPAAYPYPAYLQEDPNDAPQVAYPYPAPNQRPSNPPPPPQVHSSHANKPQRKFDRKYSRIADNYNSLEELLHTNTHTCVKKCFHGANYEWHMPALEELKVDNCGITTLFTCSVFRTLQQLKDLIVSDCRLLEEIVEDARGNETCDTNDKNITLPHLSRVDLEKLPKLKSFSSISSYAFSMPELLKFSLYRCPQIENFTFLKTSTTLVSVYSDWHQGGRYPDLSDYIRENCKREYNFKNSSRNKTRTREYWRRLLAGK